jgi:uncharacterized protein (DUF3820 family)
MISEKALKVLRLALDPAAEMGEWHAAAIAAVSLLRKDRIDLEHMFQPALRQQIDYTMPFGKFRGCSLQHVPTDYLRWAFENAKSISPELRKRIQTELEDRTQ